MKVKCIDNYGCSELTIGKIYDIIGEYKYSYRIIDNYNNVHIFLKNRFKVAILEMRNEKINKLLNQ
jgi:rRNA processing protein Gar1